MSPINGSIWRRDKILLSIGCKVRFAQLLASINGQFTLRTANDDKFSSANATHVSFTVNQDSTVYVL